MSAVSASQDNLSSRPPEEEIICTFEIDLAQTPPAIVHGSGGTAQLPDHEHATPIAPADGTFPTRPIPERDGITAEEIETWETTCRFRDGTTVPVRVHTVRGTGARTNRLLVAVEGRAAEPELCSGDAAVVDTRRLVQEMREELVQDLAAQVLEQVRRLGQASPARSTAPVGTGAALDHRAAAEVKQEELTAGEMAVLHLVAQGMDNRAIAAQLSLSEKTITNRLSEIYQKLHVRNRTQAALYALRQGWAS